ncbi:MAG: aldo/keto reductase [Solirubrobacteraceae bacterium]
MSDFSAIALNDGSHIPQLGFGVFQVPPEDTTEVATVALQCGYRAIDTAAAYGNEAGVGAAVHASGLPREELFVTTKLWNSAHGREKAFNAFEKSLGRLALDYVDLYLIHWPVPAHDRYVETWKALIELREQGRVRSIGVSNFLPEHLDRIIEESGVVPAVNQIELHPKLQQDAVRRYHEELGIATEAWSPLAQGDVLEDPVIGEIAAAHGKTPAQVVLRWHLQLWNVVIPKSVTTARIRENFDLLGFALTAEQLERIGELDSGERTGPDPALFGGS